MASIDLQACVGELREAYLRGRRGFERAHLGGALRVTCTHRTPREQFESFKRGRELRNGVWVLVDKAQRVTNCDGTIKLSKHNYYPARAVDFCVTWGGKISWRVEDYKLVGPYMEAEGLRWGGNWDRDPDTDDGWDWPHVELPNEA